jgi:hypothetical protein
MNFWRKCLHRWAGTLPTRIIYAEHSEFDARRSPLFERGHVFTMTLPVIGEVTLYLHHYLRADPDRGMHDHPWPWAIALPLAGGYLEQRLTGMHMGHVGHVERRRWPFLPYRLTGFDFHRVLVETGDTSWSLFFTGRNGFKPWGFLRPLATTTTDDRPGVYYDMWESDEGSHTAWWCDAPRGRELERAGP